MKIYLYTLLFLGLGSSPLFSQYKIFWGDQSSETMNGQTLDASQSKVLAKKQAGIRRVCVDEKNSQVFWTNFDSGSIWRSDLNGKGAKRILNLNGDISVLALDKENDLLYFTENNAERIQIVDLDGNDRRNFLENTGVVQGIDFDYENDMVYWTDLQGGRIMRAASEGTDVEVVFGTEEMLLFDLTIDQRNRQLYFSDRFNNAIHRMDLSGSNRERVLELEGLAGAISMDEAKGYIYYKEGDKIQRAMLEDMQPETVVSGVAKLSGLDVYSNEESMAKRDH